MRSDEERLPRTRLLQLAEAVEVVPCESSLVRKAAFERGMGMLHTFYGMRGTLDAATLAQRQVADMLRAAIASA